jgi:hypothetical protein
MRTLEQSFSRKGIRYDTIDRTERVGFFKLSLDNLCVGWEVSRITQNDEYFREDVLIPAGESISSDEAFGKDGSKSFFPDDEADAREYFISFNLELELKDEERAENTKISIV